MIFYFISVMIFRFQSRVWKWTLRKTNDYNYNEQKLRAMSHLLMIMMITVLNSWLQIPSRELTCPTKREVRNIIIFQKCQTGRNMWLTVSQEGRRHGDLDLLTNIICQNSWWIHPGTLTWNLNVTCFKRKIHVNQTIPIFKVQKMLICGGVSGNHQVQTRLRFKLNANHQVPQGQDLARKGDLSGDYLDYWK